MNSGWGDVSASVDGYLSASVGVPPPGAPVVLRLARAGVLHGRVRDAASSSAIAGARVVLANGDVERATTTDAEGAFSLALDVGFRRPCAAPSLARPSTIVAMHRGDAPAGTTVTDLSPVTLRLARPAAVEGVVLDAHGEPVAGVAIHLDVSPVAWAVEATPLS